MTQIMLCVVAIALAGCASIASPYEPPIVDMTGVDPVRYNNDLGECTRKRQDAMANNFVVYGPIITNCMKERGYTIIAARG